MKFLTISKTLLISIMPFLLFLIVLNFVGFDKKFYHEKFLEYGVQKDLPNAVLLHETVINFIKGKDLKLPDELNEREKQHLWDVRSILAISKVTLYALLSLFILLFIASAFILKTNNNLSDFAGAVLFFGGLLTIASAVILIFFINFNFSTFFESFHKILFKSGTYTFDPSADIIIKIYPEQLFIELGARIFKVLILVSLIIALTGVFSTYKKILTALPLRFFLPK